MKKILITIFIIFCVIISISDKKVRNDLRLDILSLSHLFLPTNNNHDYLMDNFNQEQISNTRISLDNLVNSDVEKDDIPSLINPEFDDYTNTKFNDDEKIIGVFINGEARAYPYSILYWHEIINDTISNTPIAVTLCPLCNTNPVFLRNIGDTISTFGVSGKLFNNCLIMHDRKTGTLWSQPWGLGILGEKVNYSLERIPASTTTLGAWRKKYPNTKVLSANTGYNRNYSHYPYGTYRENDEIYFPITAQENLKTAPKEIISYVYKADNKTPLNKLSGASFEVLNNELREKKDIQFIFNNIPHSAKWDEELQTPRFFDEKNNEIPSSTGFAFFYPAYFQ